MNDDKNLKSSSPTKMLRQRTTRLGIPESEISKQETLNKEMSLRKQLLKFVNGRYLDYIIIGLVIIYTILIFIYFALDTNYYEDNQGIQKTIQIVTIIDMIILILFALEICLRIWAKSIKEYFNDLFYIFDTVVILLSIALLTIDYEVKDQNFKTSSKILRGIFRFLRLFLVFRKVTQFSKIQNNLLTGLTKTPVERLIEIFQKLKENVDDNQYIQSLDWSIEKISNNELYKPMFDKDEKQAAQWASTHERDSKKLTIFPVKNDNSKSVNNTRIQINPTEIDIIHEKTFVQKMPLPQHIQQSFMQGQTVEAINFDIFGLHALNKGNELSWLIIYLFQYKHDICQELNIDPKKLFQFTSKISAGYLETNPYHNKIHAFDVTTTVNFFLSTCQFQQIGNLSKFELAYMYLGAACHDYQHPGVNNMFLINTRSELAYTYNDKSPLENHHVSASLILMKQQEYDILQNFNNADKSLFRQRMIAMILATDMSLHFADLAKLKGRQASQEFDPKTKDKSLVLDSLLHAADISNPFKPFIVYEPWAKRVLAEFWNQGDLEREKELPVSYLCDRFTVNTAKSQLGFIDFIVKPFYETIAKCMPKMQPMLKVFEENKQQWASQIDFYDSELDRINQEETRQAEKEKTIILK